MEFQAVVLCGPGKHLHPITSGTSKALLPVGNKPLLSYALEFCQKARFSSVVVAVNHSDLAKVQQAISPLKFANIDYFGTPDNVSSGKVLQLLNEAQKLRRQHDVVVLPCDFLTETDPETLISAVRSQEGNIAISGFYYTNKVESLDTKVLAPDVLLHSSRSSSHPQSYTTSLSHSQEILLDSYDRQHVKDAKMLKPRMAMLWQFPHVVASMDLLKTGIYFINRKVFSYDNTILDMPIPKLVRDLARRTWCQRGHHETVVLHRVTTSFLRANNLAAYTEANRQVLKDRARSQQQQQMLQQLEESGEKPKRIPGQAVIGNDSIVGDGTLVGERSSVKRTSIGLNCTIGKHCRLNGCVILDGVNIGNDVTLENCLVGAGSVIEQRSKLVSCTVEGGYAVVSETEAKNEVLKGLSMEGIDNDEFGDMYESLSDSDSSGDESSEEEQEEEDDDDDDLFDRT